MIKIGVIVGGRSNVKSVMQIHSLFTSCDVRIKAVDILGTDIGTILDKSAELDYLFLDRHSTIATRLKLVRRIHKLKCNMVMFKSAKSIEKTKFYNLYENQKDNTEILNKILKEKCNTTLRKVCSSKDNKLRYKLYLAQQTLKDITARWLKEFYQYSF